MDNEQITECDRAAHLDCQHYQVCLLEAARLNLKGIFCRDCPDYEKDPGYMKKLRENCYFCNELIDLIVHRPN